MIAHVQPMVDFTENNVLLFAIVRFQNQRTHDRTQSQRHNSRNQYGYSDGNSKLAVKLARNSAEEAHRHKYGTKYQRGSNQRTCQSIHGFLGSFIWRQLLFLHNTLYIFHHYNSIIHHNTDGKNVTGSSPRVGSNQARSELTVILKPWEDRKDTSIDEIMSNVRHDLSEYPECKVYLSTPPVIPGLGTSGGFEMQLEARGEATFENLVQAADTLMYYASQRKELTGLSSSLQSDIPQLYFDVDRDKVKMLGVPLADVFSTMKAYTGSVYVNDFNMFNRIYKVYIQAEAPYREHKDNINLFFVKASNGAMIPLTSLGNASYTTGPGSIKRFNMFTTAVFRGEAAQGYSSGQAMEIMEQIARYHLPDNIGLEWSGLSYQEKKAGGQTGLVLALVFLFVFLFLAAQYESWTVPIAVLLSLPVAALGAYLGVWVCGLENDVYFQIGLVMLVGLAAKNAILIVEFAKVQVDRGGDLIQSAIHAAQLRFRPILMTSLAFVLGMLPMVLATGPGSASRAAIGTGVFFGMIFAIVVGIILVPFFFVLVYKTKAKLKNVPNVNVKLPFKSKKKTD